MCTRRRLGQLRESDGGDKLKIRKERHYLFAQRSVDTITTAFVHFVSFSKRSPWPKVEGCQTEPDRRAIFADKSLVIRSVGSWLRWPIGCNSLAFLLPPPARMLPHWVESHKTFPILHIVKMFEASARVRKSENFPDSKIFVAKTFRIKRVNCVNF